MPDINVLIYAHREDAPEHERYAAWLRRLASGPEPFALSSWILSGFLRIVTNPRIFDPATPTDTAIAFCRRLRNRPHAVSVAPGPRHWRILVDLIERADVRGALVSDAHLAALAIEQGCELVTTDGDFGRFPDLRWRHPLAPRPSGFGGPADSSARPRDEDR
ncbi:MAG: type II toxin-antitoxin system VapC family toxin [Acidobacteriota bacterium]|jgi:toxin-antitoxin system PIN domain toxin